MFFYLPVLLNKRGVYFMNTTMSLKRITTKKLTYCALLVGLCYIGALIKVQGSIAFDSMPAYFAALFLGPSLGAVVGFLGHLLTAITSGFPMSFPMHFIVAIEMAFFVYSFGWLYKKTNIFLASVAATILNGPFAALLAVPVSLMLSLPFSGWALYHFLVVPLTLASVANILLAVIVYRAIKKRFR